MAGKNPHKASALIVILSLILQGFAPIERGVINPAPAQPEEVNSPVIETGGHQSLADVHLWCAQAILQKRRSVLPAVYTRTPERFVKGLPVPMQASQTVWINPPKQPVGLHVEQLPASDPGNENENSCCKSAVPVSLGADLILHEACL